MFHSRRHHTIPAFRQVFLYAYLIRESPHSAWRFFAATWLVFGAVTVAAFARGTRPTARRPRGWAT